MSATQNLGPLATNGIPLAIWNMPALAPPAGVIPNFDHPINKDRELIALNSTFLALMIMAVVMRFIVIRRPHEKRMTWDGVMCLIAAAGSITHSAMMLSGLHIGYGRHLWEIRAVTLTKAKLLHLSQLTTPYNIAICFAKLSVLLVYLRMFEVMEKTRVAIYCGIVVTVASCIAFVGVGIAQAEQCISLSAFSTPGWCNAMPKVVVVQAAVNVFLDFYILAIPLQRVVKLQVDMRRKLGVAAIFGIGFLACVVSVLRLAFSILHMHEADEFWGAILTSEFSIAELNMVIICPCLLFVPAFITSSKAGLSTLRSRLTRSSRFSSSKGSSKGSSHGSKNSSIRNGNSGEHGSRDSNEKTPQQAYYDVDFITKPDSHSEHSATPITHPATAKRRESDAYVPV